ncbi:MAG TPA: aldose epimerase family protein [Bacteroidota bacterium]|nr:aldose epimerase family protein [Bacteroidota bacterium]
MSELVTAINPQEHSTRSSSEIVINRLGNALEAFEFGNRNGMRVTILNYGATLARLEFPDRQGNIADVLLGHDDLSKFIGGRFYFGGTIGRFANRIAGGKFTLDGKHYQLSVNNKGNMLHGGASGFDKKFWEGKILNGSEQPSVEFSYVSADGEEGFPGAVRITIVYTVTDGNELKIRYEAVSDQPTIINMTNHAYFNLAGAWEKQIVDHVLRINASHFTPTDGHSIPTGEIRSVEKTPMDFRRPTIIGAGIDASDEQLAWAGGFDHNWVIDRFDGSLREAAALFEPTTGRTMHVFTDQPGLQFYSGNYLDGTQEGKNGVYHAKRTGLCLECQHFPNSPNVEKFPSTVLRPGRVYTHNTVYKFSIN